MAVEKGISRESAGHLAKAPKESVKTATMLSNLRSGTYRRAAGHLEKLAVMTGVIVVIAEVFIYRVACLFFTMW